MPVDYQHFYRLLVHSVVFKGSGRMEGKKDAEGRNALITNATLFSSLVINRNEVEFEKYPTS